MMVKTKIIKNYDLEAIVRAAGQTGPLNYNYFGGYLFVEGVLQDDLDAAAAAATPIDPMVYAQGLAKKEVDRIAGKIREKYLTLTAGQEMTYLKKEDDAEAFKLAGYPEADIADYPWIQAESNAQNDTGQQVTDAILAQRDLWLTIGTQIEEERITGKVQIDQQLGSDGINTAKETAIAALEAI